MEHINNESQAPRLLFCFDFDETIVKAHFHHILHDLKREARKWEKEFNIREEVLNLLNDSHKGIKNPELLIEIFKEAFQKGHEVAITSFSSFPEAIKLTLESLSLNEDELEKIKIFSGLPKRKDAYKNDHIKQAMQEFGIVEKSNVYLIDDDMKNCEQARFDGFNTVRVYNTPRLATDHLINLRDIVRGVARGRGY